MSVDMNVVGVMAAYLLVVRVCTAQSREALECVCTAQSREALDCVCVLYSLERH